MLTFLFFCTALLLVITVICYWQIFKMPASEFFGEWETAEMGNAGLQILYALIGVYVFYVLTVITYAKPALYLGLLTALESLVFLVAMRRYHHHGTMHGYYRSGVGLYLSALFQVIFLIAALYYLYPRVF